MLVQALLLSTCVLTLCFPHRQDTHSKLMLFFFSNFFVCVLVELYGIWLSLQF